MVKDLGVLLFETVVELVLFILDSLGSMFGALSIEQYISGVPPEVGYYMNAMGFSQAMGMIITCLTIRVLLQLIPFVRLGS